MLADALPDDFGNALIDAWMAMRGVEKDSITILDRLAYMGKRGMGALEFRPARGSHSESATPIAMKSLVEEARKLIQGNLSVDREAEAAIAELHSSKWEPLQGEPAPKLLLPGIQSPMRSEAGNLSYLWI